METDVEPVPSGGSLGRRGLQIRQRRQINVHRPEEEGFQHPAVTTVESSVHVAIPVTAATAASKYAPKIYVPEKKQPKPVASSYSTSIQSTQYGTGQETAGLFCPGTDSIGHRGVPQPYSYNSTMETTDLYSSRVLKFRDTAPDPNAVVPTSRGLFKMRQRRNIRVNSSDELESDSARGSDEPHQDSGFIRDTSGVTRDRLARQGRQTVMDMMGAGTADYSRSSPHQSPAVTGPPALMPPGTGDISVLQPVSDLYNKYAHLAGRPITEPRYTSQPVHSLPSDTSRRPFFLDDEPKPEQAVVPVSMEMEQHKEPFMEHHSEMIGHNEGQHNSHSSDVHMMPELDPTLVLSYEDRVAELKERLRAKSPATMTPIQVTELDHSETLEEKKERILGNLHRHKYAAEEAELETLVDPLFETLEQKKARIFANLRRKHNANLQAQDLLGLTAAEQSMTPTVPPIADVRLNSVALENSWSRDTKPSYTSSLSHGAISGDKSRDLDEDTQRKVIMFGDSDGSLQNTSHATGHQNLFSDSNPPEQISNSHMLEPEMSLFPQPKSASTTSNCAPETGGSATGRPGSFQIRAGSRNTSFLERNSSLSNTAYSNSNSSGSRSQGQSPNEDMMSVDSGFHDKMGTESTLQDERQTANKDKAIRRDKTQISSPKDSQKIPPKSPVGVRKYPKPWSIAPGDKASKHKTHPPKPPSQQGSMTPVKKSGPPTKPKPQRQDSSPATSVTRSRSVTPNKSKSTTNLSEIGLSTPRERSSSDLPEPVAFQRNSRVRASTKAWEIRQTAAEQKRQVESKPKTTPKVLPKPLPAKKSVIVGKVSLSSEAEFEQAERSTHTPRSVSTYDKPWRTGTVLAAKSQGSPAPVRRGSRSDTRERSGSLTSSRPESPSGYPRSRRGSRDSTSSSRTQSPSGTRAPKNPVKGQGSVDLGCPRSPKPTHLSPPSEPFALHTDDTGNNFVNTSHFTKDSEYGSDNTEYGSENILATNQAIPENKQLNDINRNMLMLTNLLSSPMNPKEVKRDRLKERQPPEVGDSQTFTSERHSESRHLDVSLHSLGNKSERNDCGRDQSDSEVEFRKSFWGCH